MSGSAPAGTALVARTRPLESAPGPLGLLAAAGGEGLYWQRDGHGLAGRGCALRVELPGGLHDPIAVTGARRALEGIRRDDPVGRPGCGPVALGALPFDRTAPGWLVVPEVTVGCDEHGAWVTTVSPEDAPPPPVEIVPGGPGSRRSNSGGEPPDGFGLVPSQSHAEWLALVADAVERIRAGDLEKVVLARRIDIHANRAFLTSDVLERLLALYPSCMVFRVEGFLGASPELLVARRGRRVRSHPLAGTIARSGDAEADRALAEGLLASAKDRAEHAYVVDGISSALAPWCDELDVPAVPDILQLRNVSHLATAISGTLHAEAPASALELVASIHPSAAVAGVPTDKAVGLLETLEGFDRGRYAGPVGWMDANGDGEWALGIRSATVSGTEATICAGVGVVGDSDPRVELAETQLKLQALLAALVRP